MVQFETAVGNLYVFSTFIYNVIIDVLSIVEWFGSNKSFFFRTGWIVIELWSSAISCELSIPISSCRLFDRRNLPSITNFQLLEFWSYSKFRFWILLHYLRHGKDLRIIKIDITYFFGKMAIYWFVLNIHFIKCLI